MFILLFVINLILTIVCMIVAEQRTKSCIDELCEGISFVTAVLCGIAFIGIIWNGVVLIGSRDLEPRIALYEEQNAKIEEEVNTAVSTYMQHENEVFTNVTQDSYITLVSLYPELKSDELIGKQIEVYLDNNEKIRELKEEKIKLQRAKFWLYFGR